MATWAVFFPQTLLKIFIIYLMLELAAGKRNRSWVTYSTLRKNMNREEGKEINMCDCSSPSTVNVLVRGMIHLCWWKLDYKCCWSRKGILKGKYVLAFMAEHSAERLLIGYMTNPVIEEQSWLEPWEAEVSHCPTSLVLHPGPPL